MVEPTRLDPHKDIIVPDLRWRDLLVLKDFGSTVALEYSRLHQPLLAVQSSLIIQSLSGGDVDAVEEVKERLPIEDVVSGYVDLRRSGASLKGLCPFHQEKTPSFYVTPARGTYHCFGCGKGGDVLSFVMEME